MGNGYNPGSYQFNQFAASVTSSGQTWRVDRDGYVREIRFYSTSALTTSTVTIKMGNEVVIDGCYISMLNAVVAGSLIDHEANGCIIFRPERPLLWRQDLPLSITPSTTVSVAIFGAEGAP